MEIKLETPAKMGNDIIVAASVRSLRFAEFARIATQANVGRPESTPYDAVFRTARMQAQTTLINDKGDRIALDFVKTSMLPIALAKLIIAALPGENLPVGQIIGDGDGITTPILFKLGTPIKGAGASSEEKPITELEFMASTYGDIENVLGEENQLLQAVALLKYVAKPIGLLRLPTWAADLVEIADGSIIVDQIVPRFLD